MTPCIMSMFLADHPSFWNKYTLTTYMPPRMSTQAAVTRPGLPSSDQSHVCSPYAK